MLVTSWRYIYRALQLIAPTKLSMTSTAKP